MIELPTGNCAGENLMSGTSEELPQKDDKNAILSIFICLTNI